MKKTFRKIALATTPLLISVSAFAEETAGGGHEMTHIQGIPVIAIVAGVLGTASLVALSIGVVAGWLTSREDWPEHHPHH
jgi:hypothetical protein